MPMAPAEQSAVEALAFFAISVFDPSIKPSLIRAMSRTLCV